MQIRSKVLISFITLVVLMALATEILMHRYVQPQFAKLEEAQLERDIRSIENLLAQEAHRIKTTAHDWGVWDQTYRFIEDRNQKFQDSNLYPELNNDLNLDFAFMVKDNGEVIWKQESYPRVPSDFLPAAFWPASHPLFNLSEVTDTGIADTPDGPVIFAVSKITQGEDSDPSNGILVFGRYLNEELIQIFRERSLLPFNLNIVEPSEINLRVDFLSNKEAISQVFLPLYNSSQQLEISLKVTRKLNQQARETIHTVTLLIFLSGLVLTLLLYLFLSRHILIPIGKLNMQAEAFGQDSQIAEFSDSNRTDEIGTLFRTFKLMARKILSYQHKLVKEKESFQKASLTDQLTGLKNRRFLDTVVYERVNKEAGAIWHFIMLDLDHFKQVNDNYGHDIGDKVLEQFAKVLQDCARHNDYVIRYGGEEFLIATNDQSYEAAEILADRLLKQISEKAFGDSTNTIKKTCSIGFFSFRAPMLISNGDMERFISYADSALYAAKNNGRNRWIGIQALSNRIPSGHQSLSRMIKQREVKVLSSQSQDLEQIEWL